MARFWKVGRVVCAAAFLTGAIGTAAYATPTAPPTVAQILESFAGVVYAATGILALYAAGVGIKFVRYSYAFITGWLNRRTRA